MKIIFILTFFAVFALPGVGQINVSPSELSSATPEEVAQNELVPELTYEVKPFSTKRLISKAQLNDVVALRDIDSWYPNAWIREYISVQITATNNGVIKKAAGENDTLNVEQKNILQRADTGSEIIIDVQYIPENNLKNNEAKKIDFSAQVGPKIEASFIGGQEKLIQYLKEKTADEIPKELISQLQWTAINFTVDELGHITDGRVSLASDNEHRDKMLLQAICDMPDWTPAIHSNGTKTEQEFTFRFGNNLLCPHFTNLNSQTFTGYMLSVFIGN